jgi:hypothetical protein
MMPKKYARVFVPARALHYGKGTGVTRREAEKAFIQGFMRSARPKRKTKYKGTAGIEFVWGRKR